MVEDFLLTKLQVGTPTQQAVLENNSNVPLTQISDEPSSFMNEELSLYFATNFLPFWI